MNMLNRYKHNTIKVITYNININIDNMLLIP